MTKLIKPNRQLPRNKKRESQIRQTIINYKKKLVKESLNCIKLFSFLKMTHQTSKEVSLPTLRGSSDSHTRVN